MKEARYEHIKRTGVTQKPMWLQKYSSTDMNKMVGFMGLGTRNQKEIKKIIICNAATKQNVSHNQD